MPRRTKKFKVGDIVVWDHEKHAPQHNGSIGYVKRVQSLDTGACNSLDITWISVPPELRDYTPKWQEESWSPEVFRKIGEVDAEEV